MIDFWSGVVIGVIAAVMCVGVWLLRIGYGDPPYVLVGGALVGFVAALIVAMTVFLICLALAFKGG